MRRKPGPAAGFSALAGPPPSALAGESLQGNGLISNDPLARDPITEEIDGFHYICPHQHEHARIINETGQAGRHVMLMRSCACVRDAASARAGLEEIDQVEWRPGNPMDSQDVPPRARAAQPRRPES